MFFCKDSDGFDSRSKLITNDMVDPIYNLDLMAEAGGNWKVTKPGKLPYTMR